MIVSKIRKFVESLYYYLDGVKVLKLNVKIDSFKFDHESHNLCVVYRLGRQKLLNKMGLSQFETEYFNKLSTYDQRRVAKFSTLQGVLQEVFNTSSCNKDFFIKYIQEEVKHEQSF